MDYNGDWVCYNLFIASVSSTRLYEQVVAELERDLDYNIKCQQKGDKSLQILQLNKVENTATIRAWRRLC